MRGDFSHANGILKSPLMIPPREPRLQASASRIPRIISFRRFVFASFVIYPPPPPRGWGGGQHYLCTFAELFSTSTRLLRFTSLKASIKCVVPLNTQKSTKALDKRCPHAPPAFLCRRNVFFIDIQVELSFNGH